MSNAVTVPQETQSKSERLQYVRPQIKSLNEREILNTFQLTQSLASWWASVSMR